MIHRQCPYCGSEEQREHDDTMAPCGTCQARPLDEDQIEHDRDGIAFNVDGQLTDLEVRLGWREGKQRYVDPEHLNFLSHQALGARIVHTRVCQLEKEARLELMRATERHDRARLIYDSLHPIDRICF